jgi:hypothetical protein
MRSFPRIATIVLSTIFLLLTSLPAFSQFQYELTPNFAVWEVYNDNIDLAPTDETSDYLTGLEPGVRFGILTQNTTFDLRYAPTFVFYKENKQNNTIRHLSTLTWDQRLTQSLTFNLTDTFYYTEQPIEYDTSVIGVRRNRQPYWRNLGQTSIRYLFGPENTLTLGYALNTLENDDPTIVDGSIQTPSAALTYWFNVKNGIRLNYEYVKAEFSRDALPETVDQLLDDDYTGNNAGARYTHRFAPQTSAFIDYSYADRTFDGLTPDYKVNQGLVGLEHAFSGNTSLLLSGGYLIQHNELLGDFHGYPYEVRLTKQLQYFGFSIGGTGGWTENFLSAQRFGFTRFTSADARLDYQATGSLVFYALGAWRLDRVDH